MWNYGIHFLAFVTKGPGTKIKHVIHVNGPYYWYSFLADECIADLKKSIENIMNAAQKNGFKSIAIPPLLSAM